jgi:hypothetical protein
VIHSGVSPRPDETAAVVAGDDVVAAPDVVMDRAFTLSVPPERAWPWFAQLGKNRAGWYLPAWAERVVPVRRRALRHLDPALQHLRPGDVIDDWGGRDATFEIVTHDPPHTLVHRSRRGHLALSWAITLRPETRPGGTAPTRVHLRLRMAGVRHRRLAEYGGGLIDLLTVAGLAAGLRERVRAAAPR